VSENQPTPPPVGGMDVLAVLDREIASLPMIARLIAATGVKCDPSEALDTLAEARRKIAELIAADKEYDEAIDVLRNHRAPLWKCEDRLEAAKARRAAALAALEAP
jgi:hypothetical protein